ncbi:MAG: hypothetical protein IPJ26_01680 [Bacteroidetes bacterium]|nr:hypothetical protein [Bacteroidota bacterium]
MKEKFSNLITPGVKHMLLATFWFALMNVMVKNLAHLPTSELVFLDVVLLRVLDSLHCIEQK